MKKSIFLSLSAAIGLIPLSLPSVAQTTGSTTLLMQMMVDSQEKDGCKTGETYVFRPGEKPAKVASTCNPGRASNRPEDTYVFRPKDPAVQPEPPAPQQKLATPSRIEGRQK